MKDNGLVNTQVTVGTVLLLKKIRQQLEMKQEQQKNNGKKKLNRITKREVCQELVKRCIAKRVI